MGDGLQIPRTSDDASIVISVDAMGGDQGPAAVVAGLALSAAALPHLRFVLHGDEAALKPLMARHPELAARVVLRHAARVVTMEDKPAQIMRHGQGTSMWGTIDSIRDGEAGAAVSCGNTGALMAVSMLRLRKLPGVNRPAIACLWPSRSPSGFNVMLDVGADVKADPKDLLQFAVMGASYARNGMATKRPRVGLLNVGTEEHKGRAEMKDASDLLAAQAAAGAYDYLGFVEGSDIPSGRVDVIVTDGFTGNVAIKTAEGTAKLISDIMREELGKGLLSRIGALFSINSLKRLKLRMDPRRVNGGVFLGLNGVVVKSHGSADATGISAAISLAAQLAAARFHERLAARVASTGGSAQDDTAMNSGSHVGAQTGQGSDPTQ